MLPWWSKHESSCLLFQPARALSATIWTYLFEESEWYFIQCSCISTTEFVVIYLLCCCGCLASLSNYCEELTGSVNLASEEALLPGPCRVLEFTNVVGYLTNVFYCWFGTALANLPYLCLGDVAYVYLRYIGYFFNGREICEEMSLPYRQMPFIKRSYDTIVIVKFLPKVNVSCTKSERLSLIYMEDVEWFGWKDDHDDRKEDRMSDSEASRHEHTVKNTQNFMPSSVRFVSVIGTCFLSKRPVRNNI